MSELQPGMLALVISAYNPENIGAVVDVIRFVNKGDLLPELGDCVKSPIDWWLITGSIKSSGGHIGVGTAYAKQLMPIRPEQDPLHEKQQQELHA